MLTLKILAARGQRKCTNIPRRSTVYVFQVLARQEERRQRFDLTARRRTAQHSNATYTILFCFLSITVGLRQRLQGCICEAVVPTVPQSNAAAWKLCNHKSVLRHVLKFFYNLNLSIVQQMRA